LSIVKILDDVTQWARQNICSQIELKVPPKNDAPNDFDYKYQKANPVAFTMYVPTGDKLPKHIPSAFPSLCVQFMAGEDDLKSMQGTLGIQLLLSAWNPGTHREDFITEQPANKQFERNGDGWRDIWNFADLAVTAVESTTNICGYEIDRSVPVKFGPMTEQEAVPDYYPFWFAWVTFQITYPLKRKIDDIQQFL
jgi:hypothetical protein